MYIRDTIERNSSNNAGTVLRPLTLWLPSRRSGISEQFDSRSNARHADGHPNTAAGGDRERLGCRAAELDVHDDR